MAKVRATMCACGSISIEELQQKARLVVVSATSIVEGGATMSSRRKTIATAKAWQTNLVTWVASV